MNSFTTTNTSVKTFLAAMSRPLIIECWASSRNYIYRAVFDSDRVGACLPSRSTLLSRSALLFCVARPSRTGTFSTNCLIQDATNSSAGPIDSQQRREGRCYIDWRNNSVVSPRHKGRPEELKRHMTVIAVCRKGDFGM